ncbi:MAG: zinc ribbon domain-containing protein [Planctomycetota bacterium]|nr:zinc ribbon domain-containing protein [Planctomycetota bacterium]
MPTYEYRCESCGHEFEKFQLITAKSLRKCPVCGKSSIKRLIGAGAGIIFKGSGFYQTDYRTESYKKERKSDKSDSTAAVSEKKVEAKDAKAGDKTEPDVKKKGTSTTSAKK